MEYHGKSDRTLRAYERVLTDFAAEVDPESADRRDCLAWVHDLRADHAPSTVATYASYLHRFYAYMVEIGVFEDNPMGLVREEIDERIDVDPTRRDLRVPEMRSFLAGIDHPLDRAVVCTLLKTGVRVGELCNLDLRDLSVSVTGAGPTRAALDNRPRSLYVDGDLARGDEVNGESRTAANKRRRATVVPVDDELRAVLARYLAIRPDSPSPARPLFCSTREAWGQRLTPAAVRSVVREHAREAGWYEAGGGAEENVTPHYFRHFFTTHMRDRTGDRGVVKYLRGDVAEDVIDTYTHDWGDRVRETYDRHVYRLLDGP
jgi:integrase